MQGHGSGGPGLWCNGSGCDRWERGEWVTGVTAEPGVTPGDGGGGVQQSNR